jgi:hypothetical protein
MYTAEGAFIGNSYSRDKTFSFLLEMWLDIRLNTTDDDDDPARYCGFHVFYLLLG